jgi:hypothetical protein
MAALILLLALSVSASPLFNPTTPIDHVEQLNCSTLDAVQVCVINKKEGNDQRIQITYESTGVLWQDASPLSAWVKLNDNDVTVGKFLANPAKDAATYTLNQWRNVQLCYHPSINDTYIYTATGYSRCL